MLYMGLAMSGAAAAASDRQRTAIALLCDNWKSGASTQVPLQPWKRGLQEQCVTSRKLMCLRRAAAWEESRLGSGQQ